MRARRLLGAKIDFMSDPSFDDPAAIAEYLDPSPRRLPGQASRRSRAPEGLPPYLAGIYESPLLAPEEERFLFRKMNYLKYRALRLREAIDPDQCDAAQLDEIERLLQEARAVKDRIIRANLRLVVSIAKKHIGPATPLFELISDGNVAMIRAVEKFDAGRGFKFSTYANWAIRNGFARSIPKEMYRRDRFITGYEETFADVPDSRGEDDEQEGDRRRGIVRGMLGRLDDRERRILISRYGIDGASEQTFEQLGRELGVSKERARQLWVRAREKLRKIAQQEGFPPVSD
jgi:RNA polymerase primary sigma factor